MNDKSTNAVHFGRIAAVLPVEDMVRAHDFYTRVFGFTKTFENGNPVGFMILKRESAELHLSLQKDYDAPPFNVAHIIVDDADALHAICQREGLRIIKGLRDHDYGLRSFVFEDRDGNRIDVGQPA